MGWTWTNKGRESVKEFFTREWPDIEIVECAVVNLRVAYMALRYTDKSKPQDVWAGILMLGYNARDPYYNFGWKDMDETQGPGFHDCPEKVLDALTPVPSRWSERTQNTAKEWRNKCRQQLAEKKNRPSIRKGSIVQLPEKVRFTNGWYEDTFKITNGRRLTARGINTSAHYKLNRRILRNATVTKG
jgi:hypothetical protein